MRCRPALSSCLDELEDDPFTGESPLIEKPKRLERTTLAVVLFLSFVQLFFPTLITLNPQALVS
jgi:hypothetical protein